MALRGSVNGVNFSIAKLNCVSCITYKTFIMKNFDITNRKVRHFQDLNIKLVKTKFYCGINNQKRQLESSRTKNHHENARDACNLIQ